MSLKCVLNMHPLVNISFVTLALLLEKSSARCTRHSIAVDGINHMEKSSARCTRHAIAVGGINHTQNIRKLGW